MNQNPQRISFGLVDFVFGRGVPWRAHLQLMKLKMWLYRWKCRRLILKTKPIITGRDNRYFAVHIMTRHSDIFMTMWAVKSFLHWAGKSYRVVLLTDDTLTANDLAILNEHLPGVEFLYEKDGEKLVQGAIQNYPLTRTFRLPRSRPCKVSIGTETVDYHFCPFSMKLLDGNYRDDTEKVMILDSDVLFFSRPTQIVEWIENRTDHRSLYMIEAYQPYFDTHYNVHFRVNPDPPTGINTGLFCYHKKIVELSAIEEWIAANMKTAFTLRTAEQHAYGYLAKLQDHEPFPSTYPFNYRQADSIATHFGIKHLFYQNLPEVYRALS